MLAVCEFVNIMNKGGTEELEPEGWVRSIPDMRRRPGGDKTKEYISDIDK